MMVILTEEIYAGFDCVNLNNGIVNLWITKSIGPRILGFAFNGKENLFALLPDAKIDYPGGGEFFLRGGHRLWYAPEKSATTYIPDNQPVEIDYFENKLRIVQPVDELTGIQKSLMVSLSPDQPKVVIGHQLENQGKEPISLAPWAITQLKPGGVAILPQRTGNADQEGLLPNRQLVLWPYTQIHSPYLRLGDKFIFVEAKVDQGALKIGFQNLAGWMAYHYQDTLFVKKAKFFPDAEYYDLGSSSECYCNPDFLELETLGPKVILEPNQVTNHLEEWLLYGDIDFSPDEEKAISLFENL